MRWIALGVVLGISVTTLGCGYALVGTASNIPEHIKTIFVEPMENRTQRTEVEQRLTRAVATELVTRRRFEVVNDPATADSTLGGEVLAFQVQPLSFDGQGRAQEYQITITAKMVFKEVATDEVLWKNDQYIVKELYPVDPGADYFNQEDLAIDEAARTFASTLVIDLLEGF